MAVHPDTQRRAQSGINQSLAEIAATIGGDIDKALTTFGRAGLCDCRACRYMRDLRNAVTQETARREDAAWTEPPADQPIMRDRRD